PTESQWEHACRAGTAARWSFGDDETQLGDHAWFAANAAEGPRPVGGRRPNAFGLLDLHGNVWEWCQDAYAEYPLEGDEPSSSQPAADAYRVFRGGGWADVAARQRCAQRAAFRADHRAA